MAESLHLPDSSQREDIYLAILPQINSLIAGEPDLIANLANVAAVLHEALGMLWTGFYLTRGDELVLGPFQGPLACTRIAEGKGVCGAAWQSRSTQVVADVEQFPGHIACSSRSRSEIVVPLVLENQVVAVLDIDSENLADFNEVDQRYLEQLALMLTINLSFTL